MGQEIVYCFKCQTRIMGSDFERGQAFRIGAQVACPQCVRSLLAHLPDPDAELERLKQQSVRKPSGSTTKIPLVRPPSSESSARMRAVPRLSEPPPRRPSSKAPLLIGAGAGGLVLLGVLVAALSSGSKPPPRAPDENVSVTGTSETKPPLKPAPAPSFAAPVTSFARELDEIDAQILPLMQKDQLRDVAQVLEAARRRRESSEWMRGIDARMQKLDSRARLLARPLIEQAAAAARRRDSAEVESLRARVDALGVATVAEDFGKAVAAAGPTPAPVPPTVAPPKPAPPKPAPPKATPLESYRGQWAKTLGPAMARAYADSVQELQKAAAGVKDEAAKKEAEQDLADLKLAADVLAEVPKLLSRWPRGMKLRLEFIGETGATESLEGTIVESGPKGVTVQAEEGILDVPPGEIGAGSVAALLGLRGERRPTDARAASVLAALDGLASTGLPEKYAALKRAPDPKEAEARKLFWGAEEDYAVMKRRGAAGGAYAELLEKHGATAFVARNKAFLEDRLAATRDYLFFAEDLSGTGTFAPSSSSKVESYWLSTAESPAGKFAPNGVEVEFLVQPGATYKAWVYAGGCCQEVFTFFLQGTGLSGPSAKNPRETVTAEPGGEEAIAVRPTTSGLKKKHADHTGPKEPDRWVWVELGTLKFAEPGVKKLRLVTDQKGFSAAYLAVSASRQGQPRDAEVKDLLRGRPPPETGPTGTILREVWKGIPGNSVSDLTKNAKYKEGKPDLSGPITALDSWSMGGDYGCRIRGYVHPPATGDYVFWIASDDDSELWLSADDTPAKKQKICGLGRAVGHRIWDADPSQKSAPVPLAAGKRYYLEVLQKQGTGAEHVAVGWQLPGGVQERPLPPTRLSAYGAFPSRKVPRPLFRPAPPPEGPLVKSDFVGGQGGTPFEEGPTPRAYLRGVKYSVSVSGALQGLQPLFFGASGESAGAKAGTGAIDKELAARPGYAVGGMIARGTDRLNAFKLVFMRISGSRLIPTDRYESGWVGSRGGGDEVKLGGDGTPVLGLFGRAGGEIDGAGLLLLGR